MSEPLWERMQAAFLEGRKPGHCDRLGYAAEIRAVADWLAEWRRPYTDYDTGAEYWFDLLEAVLRAEAFRADADHDL